LPVIRRKFVTRRDIEAHPERLYVFGDNLQRRGLGGQAAECRGASNAVGIPTKRAPSMDDAAFFTDGDFERVKPEIDSALEQLAAHLAKGGEVVIPSDGIGTGLANLPRRAPRIWQYIDWNLSQLERGPVKE
jgi:hypothetical protein